MNVKKRKYMIEKSDLLEKLDGPSASVTCWWCSLRVTDNTFNCYSKIPPTKVKVTRSRDKSYFQVYRFTNGDYITSIPTAYYGSEFYMRGSLGGLLYQDQDDAVEAWNLFIKNSLDRVQHMMEIRMERLNKLLL